MGRAATVTFAALATLAALVLRSPSPSPACGASPGRPAAPPPEYEEESPLLVAPAVLASASAERAMSEASSPPLADAGDGGAHLP